VSSAHQACDPVVVHLAAACVRASQAIDGTSTMIYTRRNNHSTGSARRINSSKTHPLAAQFIINLPYRLARTNKNKKMPRCDVERPTCKAALMPRHADWYDQLLRGQVRKRSCAMAGKSTTHRSILPCHQAAHFMTTEDM
jgi:hypothetical protein